MPQYTIKTGDTLSQLAQQYKTDIPTLQKLNPQITDINKIYAGGSLNLPEQVPTQTPTITADQLSTTPPPKLPEPIVDTTNYNGLNASVKTPEPIKEKTPLEIKQEETSGIIARAKELMGITGGKEAFEAEQKTAQGYAEKQAQIEDISAQIEALKLETEAGKASIAGEKTSKFFQSAEMQGLERQNAIKALTLSSQLLAAQGKFNAAKLRVEQAVSAKYAGPEAELKNKIAQLEFITKYELTPLETKRKEELQAKAKTDAEALAIKKAQELDFNKNIVDAQQGGIKQSETDRARALFEAGRIDEANAIIAPYSSKKERMDIARERLVLAQEKGEEESVVDIRQRKKDTADLLGQVASYTTREEALAELNRYQSSIFEKVGQEGLDKLKVEVDRLFPEKKEEIKEEKVGETTGLFGSFFSRLFGK